MKLSVRPAKLSDLWDIMEIIDYAKALQQEQGNLNQWGENYPLKHHIESDIEQGESYVVVSTDQDGEAYLVGTFCLMKKPEQSYTTIEGSWLNDAPYVTVHRMASRQCGTGRFIIESLKRNFLNIRIDTHRDNAAMLHLLSSSGFEYCGKIQLINGGGERLAFHYVRED
ncbi:GNAT family N-acetyltransferase [Falseniella ignava]|uniref:GNAT family N-acetyltransferase n=1 Tax=Falseniella ignava TaxID=137730 RepID=A0A2I1K585_9LACT|nr:GNAT family N-acetyltransferase [Falseniella ignava]PKY90732.1 GNAT family N-acetyltransferase [Falseniella ignava]